MVELWSKLAVDGQAEEIIDGSRERIPVYSALNAGLGADEVLPEGPLGAAPRLPAKGAHPPGQVGGIVVQVFVVEIEWHVCDEPGSIVRLDAIDEVVELFAQIVYGGLG